eukprot:m51a1_g1764 hypothetical protein (238) ;mRNA; f:296194-297136
MSAGRPASAAPAPQPVAAPVAAPPPGAQLVKLSVGGRRFVTTRSTIFAHGQNFLTLLVQNAESGKMSVARDEDGYLFIDRNGRVFEIILDYLRTGKLYRPKDIPPEQVVDEFDFYGVTTHEKAMSLCEVSHGVQPDQITQAIEKWRERARGWVDQNHVKLLAYNIEHVVQGSKSPALQFFWHQAQFVLREISFSYEWGLSALWRSHVAELLSERFNAIVTIEYSGSSSILTMIFQWA